MNPSGHSSDLAVTAALMQRLALMQRDLAGLIDEVENLGIEIRERKDFALEQNQVMMELEIERVIECGPPAQPVWSILRSKLRAIPLYRSKFAVGPLCRSKTPIMPYLSRIFTGKPTFEQD